MGTSTPNRRETKKWCADKALGRIGDERHRAKKRLQFENFLQKDSAMWMRVTAVIVLFAAIGIPISADEPKEMPKEERQKLEMEAKRLNAEGVQLFDDGKIAAAVAKTRQALTIFRRLYPEAQFREGHPDLNRSINNLAYLLKETGAYEQALPLFEESLSMRRKLYPATTHPNGHPDLATSFNNLGGLYLELRWYDKALVNYESAHQMRKKLFPEDKFPDGHSALAESLNNLGGLHQTMGEFAKALPWFEQALAMNRRIFPTTDFPDGHPNLALSLDNLGGLFDSMGLFEKALPYFDQALAMRRRLYPASKFPDGHPALGMSLTNLGYLMLSMGSLEEAASYFEQDLEMSRRLYRKEDFADGHPDLSTSLGNLAGVLVRQGTFDKALLLVEQSLAMERKLFPASSFPEGHARIAQSLSYQGIVLEAKGEVNRALECTVKAHEMCNRIYPESKFPNGHPQLIDILDRRASLLQARRDYAGAIPLYQRALALNQRWQSQILAAATESEALTVAESAQALRDGYVSATAHVEGAATEAYRSIWDTKSAVMRVLERRHANARTIGTEHGADLEHLANIRRRMGQIMSESRLESAERNDLLAGYARTREELERRLALAIPPLQRWRERDSLGPEDLVKALPAGTVFVDFLRYYRFDNSSTLNRRKGEKRTQSYVAFVLSPRQAIRRIDLGDSKPIDAAVRDWRTAISEGRDDRAPMPLADLWKKIDNQLPAGTNTLYLALDGELTRIPFSALPGKAKNSLLLEEFEGGIAVVPHGPFLFESLRFPLDSKGKDRLLAVGRIDYGKSSWSTLPGTQTELAALIHQYPGPQTTLDGQKATSRGVVEAITQARYTHLATHGYFAGKDLAGEQRQQEHLMSHWRAGEANPMRVAAQNPLGYVGLVLANGEVLSGLSIVDLPLQNLKLIALSACETGLGEITGGEGVQGLQRAFHLAGCPNVVASLWKVSDSATAALMAKFYYELWVKKRPPIEALREAQLTIYRHPERIPALAGERGKPDQAKTVELKIEPRASAVADKRTPTKLWAAFMLSGVGK